MKKILVIITFILVLSALGFVFYNKSHQATPGDLKAAHQKLLNNFVDCAKQGDAQCACKFITKSSCDLFSSSTEGLKSIGAAFNKNSSTELLGEVADTPGSIPDISYNIKAGLYTKAIFINEEGVWKLHTLD